MIREKKRKKAKKKEKGAAASPGHSNGGELSMESRRLRPCLVPAVSSKIPVISNIWTHA
jgi:hypothetical protein